MNVSFTPELEDFIGKRVSRGVYQTVSGVVRKALRLLKEREEKSTAQLRPAPTKTANAKRPRLA